MQLEERIRNSENAGADSLWTYVRDSHPDVLLGACLNRNLSEEMAVAVARNRNASPEVLGMLAGDARFKGSYPLKLSICRNPRTPQKVVFSLLKFLKIFDLGDLTRDRKIPVNVRQRIEYALFERIPALPSGIKTALAKRSSIPVVSMLMERGDAKVARACLEIPSMTEHHVRSIVLRNSSPSFLIRIIAEHPSWSLRYDIRYALIRNRHTPTELAVRFIQRMKTPDLRDLYADEAVPPSVRPFLHRELYDRNEPVKTPEVERYELPDDDSDAGETTE